MRQSVFAIALAILMVALQACNRNEQGNLEAPSVGDLSHGEPPSGAFDADRVRACGNGGATELGEEGFVRPPYLQSVHGSVASVLWTTEATAESAVEIRLPGTPPDGEVTAYAAAPDSGAEPPRGRQLRTVLTGLRPGELYCYRITSPEGPWTEWTGFRTAPAAGQPARIAVLGDLGAASSDQRAVLAALATVPLDVILVTGDVGYEDGRLSELESNFFAVYKTLMNQAPFFPVAGNHDYRTRDAEPLREAFALPENGGPGGRERWYSFDWGDVHIAAVDTEMLGPAQLSWLKEDLSASDARWKVVFGHVPPYSSGHHGSNKKVRRALEPILERHGVDIALFGHDHNYERTVPIGGVTYVVTGGGGRGTRPVDRSSYTAFSSQVAHFVLLEAKGDQLTVFAIDATGKLFDSAALPARR